MPSNCTCKCGRADPPSECFNTRTVLVLVGPDQVEFRIHHGLLTHYSKMFKSRLDGEWGKDESKPVILSEEDPHTFRLFNVWIYSGEVPVIEARGPPLSGTMMHWSTKLHKGQVLDVVTERHSNSEASAAVEEPDESATHSNGADDRAWTQCELARLWIFAHFVQCDSLMCDTVNALITSIDRQRDVDAELPLQEIYKNTEPGAALRRVLVTAFVVHSKVHRLLEAPSQTVPVELWEGIARQQAYIIDGSAQAECERRWKQLKPHHYHGPARAHDW